MTGQCGAGRGGGAPGPRAAPLRWAAGSGPRFSVSGTARRCPEPAAVQVGRGEASPEPLPAVAGEDGDKSTVDSLSLFAKSPDSTVPT